MPELRAGVGETSSVGNEIPSEGTGVRIGVGIGSVLATVINVGTSAGIGGETAGYALLELVVVCVASV